MPPIQQAATKQLKDLLQDTETFASTLLVLVLDTYGSEALTWSPTTLHMEISEDYGVSLPQSNLDKLMAAIGLLTSDQFFKSLPAFIRYCNVLSGDEFNPLVFNPAEPEEMAWAITEALLLSPPDEEEPFVDEIRWYIGEALSHYGFQRPPDILRIALSDKPSLDPRQAFADDPELLAELLRQPKQDRAEMTNQLVRENLRELLDQLADLPLVSGSAKELAGKLRSELR